MEHRYEIVPQIGLILFSGEKDLILLGPGKLR